MSGSVPEVEHFDVIVIGSGPGGYVCAIKCAQLGLKTLLVEKYATLGGTCLNVGCIPSKALLDSSERYFSIKHAGAEHGIHAEHLSIDWGKMQGRVSKVVQQTCEGIQFLMKKNKITVWQGVASFMDEKMIAVRDTHSQELLKTASGNHIVIATGAKPAQLPHIKLDDQRILSSTKILKLSHIPKTLAVIGAGAIGLELGSVYARLGTKVQIFEVAPQILPNMDGDVAKELTKVLKKEGMEIHLNTNVQNIASFSDHVLISAQTKEVDLVNAFSVEAEFVLLAVGRQAYTEGLGLEKVGIAVDSKGKIIVNEKLQTKYAHIYAIGDVVQGLMLAHKAEEEGIFVAETIAGQKPVLHHELIPSVVYTWPEVASIGKSEKELQAKSIVFNKGIFPFKALGRARASEDIFGFVKILSDPKTDEILGMHIVGARAADLIQEGVVAMQYRASAEDLARICHAHPTFSEAIKEAAHLAWQGKTIHL